MKREPVWPHNQGMKSLVALALVLVAAPAFAEVRQDVVNKIEKVQAERDIKMMNRYHEELNATKGNPAGANAVQQRYAPMYDKKVIGTDPALDAEQRVKLRRIGLEGAEEEISDTEAEISATTVKDWADDVARDHAIDTFRDNDPKAMKMMFDARKKDLEQAPRR